MAWLRDLLTGLWYDHEFREVLAGIPKERRWLEPNRFCTKCGGRIALETIQLGYSPDTGAPVLQEIPMCSANCAHEGGEHKWHSTHSGYSICLRCGEYC